MFFENAHLQQPRCYHEFFLRSRPYRGEPPTVAGFLLYPDTPVKMETTSREAFSFRSAPQRNRGKGDRTTLSTQQESFHPHPTSSRQTGKGNSNRAIQTKGDEQEGIDTHSKTPSAYNKEHTTEMKSQYQKDFPPPSSCRMRRTPALPQPDNIGINPAFRIEFSTVQRDAYPAHPIKNTRHAGRLRAALSTHQI
ncbi:uncharacterized protein si:dkeyp-69c1.9 isoform X2 [Melanotaenia boesemani]|uniref:uncharacterized protein si:dkeyp-69c1.9 isoform X2 n=1 Tax=Melanotaenia boesemani TaxID=1250792 RepID=UPI001C05A0E7|nr:uncharacterized protein si:dkeyp-69c1.9 isoform X2 [Melanotaenia boesemani]